MSTEPTAPPPSYEAVFSGNHGNANIETVTVPNTVNTSRVRHQDQRLPPPREAFVASSSTEHAAATGAGTSEPVAEISKEDRKAMILKLHLLLVAIQFAAVASVCFFTLIEPISSWLTDDGLPLVYFIVLVFLWIFFVMVVIRPEQNEDEGNGICFIIFTFAYASLVGTISGHFATLSIILLAASVMMGLTYLSVAIFSLKADINMKKGLIFVTIVVVIVIGVICAATYFVFGPYELGDSFMGGGIALLHCQLFTVSIQLMLSEAKLDLTKVTPCLAFFYIFWHLKDAICLSITTIIKRVLILKCS